MKLPFILVAAVFFLAQAPAAFAANTKDVVVQFPSGSTGTTLSDKLGSEHAIRYVLGAREGQFLSVGLEADNALTYYIVYVPNGDILFESSQGGNDYVGQLFVSGDHVVEVFYKGEPGTRSHYDVHFSITATGSSAGTTAGGNGSGASEMPSENEQACLQAVSMTTNNGDVVTLSVETSEANDLVMVGVGPDRAPWRCLAKHGKVAEVMSMTDEGAL